MKATVDFEVTSFLSADDEETAKMIRDKCKNEPLMPYNCSCSCGGNCNEEIEQLKRELDKLRKDLCIGGG